MTIPPTDNQPSSKSSSSSSSSNDGLFQLFDKYMKASDNFLPLKAYLESVENETYDEFNLITNVKLVSSNASGEPVVANAAVVANSSNVSHRCPPYTSKLSKTKFQVV